MVKHSGTSIVVARLLLSALVALISCASVMAQGQAVSGAAVTYKVTQASQRLEMIVNSSKILTLEKVVPRFQVQNEDILIANPVAPNQIQVSAQAAGVTQLNLWDVDDTLYTVDIIVTGDARELSAVMTKQFPFATLGITPLPTGVVIDGTVTDADDIDRVIAVAEQFYPQVVNNIKVVGVQTILLHTKIMEVSRTKVREMGIDWGAARPDAVITSGVGGLLNPLTSTTASIVGAGNTNARVGLIQNGRTLEVFIRALSQNNCAKILAEPTVVAVHGRPARFIVGGRFPIISPTGNGNNSSVSFEEFGTSVDFVPFVVGPGRVRLEVRPEVSERDDANGVQLNGFTVPALRQRYVETAVEMQAGQTYAIAGLLQNRNETVTTGVPFLGSLPWVGAFFRRNELTENQIELLVMVTPELVDAMDPHEVPPGGPGLNTTIPTDKELMFKGYIEVPNVPNACMSGGCYDDGGMIDYGQQPIHNGQETIIHQEPSYQQ